MAGQEYDDDGRDRLVAALLTVPGVAGVELSTDGETGTDDPSGLGALRLQLEPGADDVAVAVAVNELLRRDFALAVDADRVEVVEETVSRPAPATSRAEQEPAGRREAAPPSWREFAAPRPAAARPASSPRTSSPRTSSQSRPSSSEPRAASSEHRSSASFAEPAPRRPPDPPRPARPAPPRRTTTAPRFVLERATFSSAGLGASVSVTLRLDGTTYIGTVEAAATAPATARAVATATLRAVEQGLADVPGGVRADVDRVEVSGTAPDRVALVVVSLLTTRGVERHAGAALVAEDSRQAVIRATLSAVNRRLEVLLDA